MRIRVRIHILLKSIYKYLQILFFKCLENAGSLLVQVKIVYPFFFNFKRDVLRFKIIEKTILKMIKV